MMRDNITPLVLLLLTLTVAGQGRRRKELPISDGALSPDQETGKDKPKASECRFGGESYELEQTWNPDLGPPFGVMYCVHCQCVPIHKKRRIVGRVTCKNIKTECPKPTCSNPILLPGRCCKVCPGQNDNPDLTITVDLEREEQERNGRHYATVLTGQGVPNAATGRFYFRKKTLQYSFLFGDDLGWPGQLSFLDRNQNILEDFSLSKTSLQNQTDKLCGAWERLPRKYRRLLRSQEMFVSLTTSRGIIEGKIKKYYGLNSEMFSGLFEGPMGAGTVIMSVSPGTGSIHANVLFKGIAKEGQENVDFVLRFHTTHQGETRSVEESVILDSVGAELNSIEVRTVFDEIELAALGKGELKLSIYPSSHPSRKLTAQIVPRISCDIFDCVLQPSPAGPDGGAGIGYMYFTREGALKYNVKTETSQEVTGLRIDNGKKSKRLLTVIDIDDSSSVISDGWVNGTAHLTAGQVDELFSESLYLSLTTESETPALRGRILTHLAGPAECGGSAALIRSDSSPVIGLAWASLDQTCRLHYTVRLEGSDSLHNAQPSLELEDYPIQRPSNLKARPLFPSTKRHLQNCAGARCSGHADNIHKLMMARLDSGDAAFLLTNTVETPFQVKGALVSVSAPQVCLPRYARNDLEIIPGYLRDLGEEIGDEELVENMRQKCVYEGSFYENGNRWEATHEQCQVCSCQKGAVKCEPIVCPPTNCSNPIIEEGSCCPTCSSPAEDGSGCHFGGDSFFHPAGSRWHPYIPPFGFSRCAICTCKKSSLTVHCYKEECPPLTSCLSKEARRENPLDCCKVCPQKQTLVDKPVKVVAPPVLQVDTQNLNDRPGLARTGLDILASGGCAWKGRHYENGESWHPHVMPWGEMKCVSCACKDGQTGCKKKHCPALNCRYKIKVQNACCQRCAANSKEEFQAQRNILNRNEGKRRKQRRDRLRRIRNQRRRHDLSQG